MELPSRRNPMSQSAQVFWLQTVLPAVSAQTFYMDRDENVGPAGLQLTYYRIISSCLAKDRFPMAVKGTGNLTRAAFSA